MYIGITEWSKSWSATRPFKETAEKYSDSDGDFMWSTVEKIFTVATPKYPQNNRLYAPTASKKRLHQSVYYAHARWWCPSVCQVGANAADIRRSCSEDQWRILPWCASHSTATACRAGDLERLRLAARQCSSAPRSRHNQTSKTGDTRVHCTKPVPPPIQ